MMARVILTWQDLIIQDCFVPRGQQNGSDFIHINRGKYLIVGINKTVRLVILKL